MHNYDLDLYPGRTTIVQILDLEGKPFAIPTDAKLYSSAIGAFSDFVANLNPVLQDGAKGLVKVTLPDTRLVRKYINRKVYFDILITTQEYRKYLDAKRLKINYSPSLWLFANPIDVDSNAGGVLPDQGTGMGQQTGSGTGTGTGTGGSQGSGQGNTGSGSGSSANPIPLYVFDQIWVDNTGRKVQATMERQPDGKTFMKLTEVTVS